MNNLSKVELDKLSYDEITAIIEQLLIFEKRISHHCKLILESNSNRYILIENAIFILPYLVEFNGQLRATAIASKNGEATQNQIQNLYTLIDKIYDLIKKFSFNCHIIQDNLDAQKIESICIDITQTQNSITEFIKNHIINKNELNQPNDIFNTMSSYIDSMAIANSSAFNLIDKELKHKLTKTKNELIYIIIFAVLSIIFISIINRIFYLKNKAYIEKIEELTITDSLTQIYNRRHFDKTCQEYLNLHKRLGTPASFIILDIDFFKQYNDTYGHQAGDKTLIEVAMVLKKFLRRSSDKAFRLGGEEFGLLCMSLDHTKTLELALKIKNEVENRKIEHNLSQVSKFVTVSIGLISLQSKINSCEDMYKYADIALYKAKENGRNRVECGLCNMTSH